MVQQIDLGKDTRVVANGYSCFYNAVYLIKKCNRRIKTGPFLQHYGYQVAVE